MLTHEDVKPHKCRVPNCPQTYCDARSLKRHIENVHQDILAAIHKNGVDDLRAYLPAKAYVKTKDTTVTSDYSIDSLDSSSSRSNTEQDLTRTHITTTYT
jgi:hypothetical protein